VETRLVFYLSEELKARGIPPKDGAELDLPIGKNVARLPAGDRPGDLLPDAQEIAGRRPDRGPREADPDRVGGAPLFHPAALTGGAGGRSGVPGGVV